MPASYCGIREYLLSHCNTCFSNDVVNAECRSCGSSQDEPNRDRRALMPGALVAGKYTIGVVLGSGGFGITYLAQDMQLSRRVALKEFFPTGLVSRALDRASLVCNSAENDEPFKRGLGRFFREGQLLAKFDHPNIVRVLEVVEWNGTAYLAMEYLEGVTLKSLLADHGPFDEQRALDVMTFVMDALRVVHGAHVVHRDLKPDNIYITRQGRTLLLDFGGAKQLTAEGDRSMDAMFAHGYAAPEQYFANSEKVGPWTDVYACGAMLYKLMTGTTIVNALDRYSEDKPLDWSAVNVAKQTRDAVAKALALKSQDRFQSIDALQMALSGKNNQSKKNKIALSIAALVLVIVGAGAWFVMSSPSPRKPDPISSEPVNPVPVKVDPLTLEAAKSEPVKSPPAKPRTIRPKSSTTEQSSSRGESKEPLADRF